MTKRKKKKVGRPERSKTIVMRVPIIIKDDVKKMVLDLRNEEGKIKTVHPMPCDCSEHDEILSQGDGFVYGRCSNCGKTF
jgi:hypothetical protein